jgi:hypothetical protein
MIDKYNCRTAAKMIKGIISQLFDTSVEWFICREIAIGLSDNSIFLINLLAAALRLEELDMRIWNDFCVYCICKVVKLIEMERKISLCC